MEQLLFGTAGIPLSTRGKTTHDGIERLAELGLSCMEVQFVQGVRMPASGAALVGEVAARRGIRLSAHGPYFINLNSREQDKVLASRERILQTARIASIFKAESIVFHAAFYQGYPPAEVYHRVKAHLAEVVEQLRSEGSRVWVRPEVTGKGSQFGTLEELLDLSSEVPGILPCIDFSHWHARTGGQNSYNEFVAILKRVEERLGRQALDNIHIHLSGIAYGKKGEIKHLVLEESDFRYLELLKALKDCQIKGMVICESPNLEEDALLLQRRFGEL